MAQLQLSDYYMKLEPKIKTQYREKISLIGKDYPYALRKTDFFRRDVARLHSLRLVGPA